MNTTRVGSQLVDRLSEMKDFLTLKNMQKMFLEDRVSVPIVFAKVSADGGTEHASCPSMDSGYAGSPQLAFMSAPSLGTLGDRERRQRHRRESQTPGAEASGVGLERFTGNFNVDIQGVARQRSVREDCKKECGTHRLTTSASPTGVPAGRAPAYNSQASTSSWCLICWCGACTSIIRRTRGTPGKSTGSHPSCSRSRCQ